VNELFDRIGINTQLDQPGSVAERAITSPFLLIATRCYMCYILPMSRIINQRELRNQSAAVLREVEAGETIVVTRNGTPVAELRPIRARRFVLRATISQAAVRAPRIDAGRFRADLDAVVDQQLDD
jgi:prevent-host-death family protein